MSIRSCFTGKIAAGQVNADAAARILRTYDELVRERGTKHAALLAASIGKAEARRKADLFYGQTIAQANVLKTFNSYNGAVTGLRQANQAPPWLSAETATPLGAALRSLLARDPAEIATWGNVDALAKQLRGEAHRVFAEAIEHLRPKGFGFKPETIRELDVLRAAFGHAAADPQTGAVLKAWDQVQAKLVDDFNAVSADGIHKAPNYFPNPEFDGSKVKALGEDRFKNLVRENVDRAKIIDHTTNEPMHTGKFERLLDDAYVSIIGAGEGIPTAGGGGRGMLADLRGSPRLFQWKDADAWTAIAETVGKHASPYEAMIGHMDGLSRDVALLRTLGPNPEATKRFALELLDREAARLAVRSVDDTPAATAAATRTNRKIEAKVAGDKKSFESLYADVTGTNRIPVSTTMAQYWGDARHLLGAAQLGSAMISSITDPGTAAMAARFNGLPVMNVITRATQMMGEKGSEVFAAQQGLVMDTLAHAAGRVDQVMGENIRTGVLAKIANANIRISGLRRWTAMLRGAFGLEMMAHVAANRELAFGGLELRFREALQRYGIEAADWDVIRAATPHEPRPNAVFIRPADVADLGRAEKLSRLITTEMDYAVIDGDPVTRAMMIGESRPGTVSGELRRSAMMYRSFPATFVMMHYSRALARGWNGQRLAHGALTFATMTGLGALAMQAKEIVAGRDPLSLDPTEANGLRGWGKAMLQGGGFGVFGDMMFVDQTRYGNSWAATFAGPVAGAVESVLGDFLIKNVQLAVKGEQTQFAGDALYTAARYIPGSSLFYAKLVFNREVLDQAALMIDPRTRERFARIEARAKKDWGQEYWWRPGRPTAERAPALGAIGGQ